MADIYCPKCGEAFDAAELHDWNERSYSENLRAFQTQGCAGIDMRCNDVPAYGEDAAMVASALYDLLGDDIDCMEDMMADARAMGLDVNV